MSVIRRFFGPRRVLAAAAGGFSIFGLTAGSAARAAEPPYPDIMPLNQLKAGMIGYGLTTFHGTTITRFEVKIIGILKKENLGRDLILIRMSGGPITERGANLIHGMSGSPIYIGGKLIGAFSMGEAFPKEPTGMVTPIEDMLDSWDPKIPQHPAYFQPAEKNSPPSSNGKPASTSTGLRWQTDSKERIAVLAHPITIGSRRITRIVLNAPLGDPHHSTLDTAVMHRATSFMFAPGISESSRKWFQELLNKRGYAVTLATGAGGGMGAGGNYTGLKNVYLKPGSCFGTFLATGDVSFGGFGTITYRQGERILGFGHPLMTLGALEGAITSAYVVDVFSGYQTSHLIPVAGPTLGTLRQDRNFSVSGDLAHRPHLIPFDVTINDRNTHRVHTFHSDVFQNPDLTSALLSLVAKETITRVHNTPGDVMADVTTTVDSAEVGSVTRTNRVFDAADISGPATQDLNDITNIVSGNPFYPLPIRSVKMTVNLYDGHDTATIERIYLKQGRFEPGDTIEVGVVLKPYRRPSVLKTVSIKIPAETPSGRYQLAVRGGMANLMRFGGLVFSGGASADPQTPPVNVRQMVARLGQKETNTDLVGRLVLNTVAPALEGEKLSQLPPNLSALMRSDRNSGVRLERDEVRSTAPTDYVVSGTQQLVVSVVRKNTQEPSGPSFGIPSSLGGGGIPSLPLSGGSGLSGASVGADESIPDSGSPDAFSLPASSLRWLNALLPAPQTDKKQAPAKPTDTKSADSKAADSSAKTGTEAKTDPPKAAAPEKPAAPDLSSDKPVGRPLQTWRQTARPDFQAGKFAGAAVAASGDLRLTASLRRLTTTTETYIWSLVPDSAGNLYAGTGTGGKVLKIDAQGKSSVLTSLPIVAVQSLLYSAKDNALYAGGGGRGNVYRIAMDGSYKLLCTLPEKYVLALAQDSDGSLYIAPGGGGNVYRLTAEQIRNAKPGDADTAAVLKPETFFKTSADHVMALLVDPQNNLYVGTGNDGILYKVTPSGVGSVVYDAKENAISGLAMTPNGTLYAVTGPKGVLYKILPNGETAVAFDRAASFYTAIRTAPDGTLYASTVNALFHIFPSPTDPAQTIVLPLDNPKDVDFLTIAVQPNGAVAAGTGNIGEIYTSQADTSSSAASAGTYTSVVHDAKLSARWGTLRWEGSLPDAAASVTAETRTGSVAEPDATWTGWSPVRSASGSHESTIASPAGRFIQYRLTLQEGRSGQSPAVREVSLGYLPRNQAPKVTFTSPTGGERWSKTQTLRWNGVDPDSDTLTYEVTYSTDAGATWKPLPAPAKPAPAATAVADTADSAKIVLAIATDTPEKMLAEYKTKVAAMNLPEAMKASIIEEYRLSQEHKAAAPASAASQRESSKSIDTTLLPDGSYWFKVVASDRASNPVDAQTTTVVSEPVTIVNAVPKITFSGQPKISSDKRVNLQGTLTQTRVTITAGQYRIDGGDWFAAAPTDGLFDSMREAFTIETLPLTSGKHTIEVEAFNSAGGKSLEKLEVTVP